MIKKKKVSEGKNSNKNYVQTSIFETEIQNATIQLNNGEEKVHSTIFGRDQQITSFLNKSMFVTDISLKSVFKRSEISLCSHYHYSFVM